MSARDLPKARAFVTLAPDGLARPNRAAVALLAWDGSADPPVALDERGIAQEHAAHPLERARRGERFEGPQTWIDRASGRRVRLHVEGAPGKLALTPTGRLPLLAVAGEIAARLSGVEPPEAGFPPAIGRLCFALGAEVAAVLDVGAQRARVAHGLPAEVLAGRVGPPGASEEIAANAEPWARALAARGLRRVHVEALDGARVLLVAVRDVRGLDEEEAAALRAAAAAWAAALRRESRRGAAARAAPSVRALAAAGVEHHPEPLRDLLRLLVVQARDLTNARYGALGVLNRERTQLADFITVGMGEEQARAIGHLPEGHGLLGAVIREAKTIRVADLSRDPRASGFPAHHPRMRSFLGVPLRVGDEIFGNFYLTDKEGAPEFTEEDAHLLEAFSAQAAVTVAYAREVGEQRSLLDAVLRQAPHAILFFGGLDQLSFSNEAAQRMLGLARRGPAARSYRLAFPDGRPMRLEDYPGTRALAGEVVVGQEVLIERYDGTRLPAFASATPVRSETGKLLGAAVALQDITPFKELERLREEFSAVVAHDLRTPLQTMLLQLDALLARADGGQIRAPVAALERMRRAGGRLEHLVRDLLDAARIETDRVHVEARPVPLAPLVQALVQQLTPTLARHPLSVLLDGEPGEVQADPLRVEQILTNLLENAAKYSAEGAPIVVRVGPDGPGAAVSVEDRGHGIAAEDLPRLFERSFQTARARAKRSGLGLGLFIAKGLTDAHRGRLTVESTPGVGSTFRLWLPAAAPGSEGAGASP